MSCDLVTSLSTFFMSLYPHKHLEHKYVMSEWIPHFAFGFNEYVMQTYMRPLTPLSLSDKEMQMKKVSIIVCLTCFFWQQCLTHQQCTTIIIMAKTFFSTYFFRFNCNPRPLKKHPQQGGRRVTIRHLNRIPSSLTSGKRLVYLLFIIHPCLFHLFVSKVYNCFSFYCYHRFSSTFMGSTPTGSPPHFLKTLWVLRRKQSKKKKKKNYNNQLSFLFGSSSLKKGDMQRKERRPHLC